MGCQVKSAIAKRAPCSGATPFEGGAAHTQVARRAAYSWGGGKRPCSYPGPLRGGPARLPNVSLPVHARTPAPMSSSACQVKKGRSSVRTHLPGFCQGAANREHTFQTADLVAVQAKKRFSVVRRDYLWNAG